MFVLKNKNLVSLDDSDDEFDEEIETILKRFITISRVSITDFFGNVVPFYSETEFIRHFRLSRDVFEDLARRYENSDVYESISGQHLMTTARKSLAIFIWFCGHEGESYEELSNLFNVSIGTLHFILRRMITFVSSLSPSVINWPTTEEMEVESEYHRIKFGLSGVIG